MAGSFYMHCLGLSNLEDVSQKLRTFCSIYLWMMFLFVVLCIQQINVKNCTELQGIFLLLDLCYIIILQNLEKRFIQNIILLPCALFQTGSCNMGSFSVKEYRGVFLDVVNLFSCVVQTEFRNCACTWGLLPNAERCIALLQRRRHWSPWMCSPGVCHNWQTQYLLLFIAKYHSAFIPYPCFSTPEINQQR